MPDPSSADEHYYISGYTVADDPCVDANGVLINKLGLTTTAELNAAEATLVAIRDATLRDGLPASFAFDLAGLQAIHYHLFQDIYPWAGDLRVVDIAKGNAFFLAHQEIARVSGELLAALAAENCLQGLEEDEFTRRAGYYFGRLNHIHPFREGNGRTQRAFLRLLANQAGYVIDFSGCSAQAMIDACWQDRRDNDPSKLIRIIRVGLSRLGNP
jgi:cell filamentation protein